MKPYTFLFVAVLIACATSTEPETRVVECMDYLTERLGYCPGLDQAREDGFSCRYDGAIRNALGGSIGDRYVCTK